MHSTGWGEGQGPGPRNIGLGHPRSPDAEARPTLLGTPDRRPAEDRTVSPKLSTTFRPHPPTRPNFFQASRRRMHRNADFGVAVAGIVVRGAFDTTSIFPSPWGVPAWTVRRRGYQAPRAPCRPRRRSARARRCVLARWTFKISGLVRARGAADPNFAVFGSRSPERRLVNGPHQLG